MRIHFPLLLFLLILSSVSSFAQERARIRVVYDFDNSVIEGRPRQQTRWAIDIGDSTVLSYNYNQLLHNQKMDSIRKVISDMNLLMAKRNELLVNYPGSGPQIIIGQPKAGQYKLYNTDGGAIGGDFQYTADIPATEWTVNDSTKTIEGYRCQQATGTVYGRTWNVWFAEELPMPYGPYLLGGLPGMILEAIDTDSLFHFTLAGISKLNDGETIAFTKTEKFLKCTREQYIKQRNKFDSMTGDERVRLAEERLTAATGKKQKIITLDKGGAETNKITTPKRIHIEKE